MHSKQFIELFRSLPVVLSLAASCFALVTQAQELEPAKQALMEQGISQDARADEINRTLSESIGNSTTVTDFEREFVTGYLGKLDGLVVSTDSFQDAIKHSDLKQKEALALVAAAPALLPAINQKRILLAGRILVWSLKRHLANRRVKTVEILRLDEIPGTESVIQFFAAQPYNMDISGHRIMVVEQIKGVAATAAVFTVTSDSDPLALKTQASLDVDGKTVSFTLPFPSAKTFFPKAMQKIYGTPYQIGVPLSTLESEGEHHFNTVLVQELHHLYDIFSDPSIVSNQSMADEKKDLEKRFASYKPELQAFFDEQTATDSFHAWLDSFTQDFVENQVETQFGSITLEVLRNNLPSARSNPDASTSTKLDELVASNRENVKENFTKKYFEDAHKLYVYLGQNIETNGHRAQLRYLKSLGVDFETACRASVGEEYAPFDSHACPPELFKNKLHAVRHAYYRKWWNEIQASK